MITLAFDIYGTLVNPAGITGALEPRVGDQAAAFAKFWREKQLEYTFRRGLMRNYRDFTTCIRESLVYTCHVFNIAANDKDLEEMQAMYTRLPVYPEVSACLSGLDQNRFRIFAFTNGVKKDIRQLLIHNGLDNFFNQIISVDAIATFKPDPRVYEYFLDQADAQAGNTWLISSNPFDVLGALHAGMQAAWIRRYSNAVFDPWGVEPSIILSSLDRLGESILQFNPDN